MKKLLRHAVNRLLSPGDACIANFNSWHYTRHNARRLEHLATLQLPIAGKRVLEVGAAIGDHTNFYIDRGCDVVATEGRADNFAVLRKRYPHIRTEQLDMDAPSASFNEPFDVIHCYGLLYHLRDPANAIAFLAKHCRGLLLIESCVSFGDEDELHPCPEDAGDATQALSGAGCRPTRRWFYNRLKTHFDFVYLPLTQPCHEEFPLEWAHPRNHDAPFTRAVFVGARTALDNPVLSDTIPMTQRRC